MEKVQIKNNKTDVLTTGDLERTQICDGKIF